MKIANDIIKAITDNYGYHFAFWNHIKIAKAISDIDPNIAKVLDYDDANVLAQSLAKSLDYDITDYIVSNKYPVWVDLINPQEVKPINDNLVITYVESFKDSLDDSIDRLKRYASSINADFVILSGRTQGSLELELFRVKEYVQKYKRTAYISIDLFLKEECPSIFDVVPEGKIGIHNSVESLSNQHPYVIQNKHRRMFLLKSDYFQRHQMITNFVEDAIKYEMSIMEKSYDSALIVCDQQHAEIWNGIHFPFIGNPKDNQRWMETAIYRNGYDVYDLESKYNQRVDIIDTDVKFVVKNSEIIQYDHNNSDNHTDYFWMYDNNLVGYRNKEPVDMSKFEIAIITHKPEQIESIIKQDYLKFVDINSINSRFDNSYTESRIFYENFDSLFDKDKEHVGLATGSWNLKYVGLNPIDQLHNWNAIRKLNDNNLICSDTEPVGRFIGDKRVVLKDVFNISLEQIYEFLELISLNPKSLSMDKTTGVSNQIIAKRHIVKSLFDFYKENEVLDKIEFFMNKYNFSINNTVYGGKTYERRSGFFAETATAVWIAQNNFNILPQEMLRKDWYKN